MNHSPKETARKHGSDFHFRKMSFSVVLLLSDLIVPEIDFTCNATGLFLIFVIDAKATLVISSVLLIVRKTANPFSASYRISFRFARLAPYSP